LTTDISGYYATWQTNVSEAFRLAGESADKFGGDGEGSAKIALENVNKALDDLLYDLSDETNGLAAKAAKAFDDMVQAAIDR
jgi:delta-aminolevulinic acid dehydratase/porphobilinogen synthase